MAISFEQKRLRVDQLDSAIELVGNGATVAHKHRFRCKICGRTFERVYRRAVGSLRQLTCQTVGCENSRARVSAATRQRNRPTVKPVPAPGAEPRPSHPRAWQSERLLRLLEVIGNA